MSSSTYDGGLERELECEGGGRCAASKPAKGVVWDTIVQV